MEKLNFPIIGAHKLRLIITHYFRIGGKACSLSAPVDNLNRGHKIAAGGGHL